MHLSRQFLFLLLFTVAARVSYGLVAADRDIEASPLSEAHQFIARHYDPKSTTTKSPEATPAPHVAGHKVTELYCVTKTVTKVVHQSKKHETLEPHKTTYKAVSCKPTVVFVPATPTHSSKSIASPKPKQPAKSSASAKPTHSAKPGTSGSAGKQKKPEEQSSSHKHVETKTTHANHKTAQHASSKSAAPTTTTTKAKAHHTKPTPTPSDGDQEVGAMGFGPETTGTMTEETGATPTDVNNPPYEGETGEAGETGQEEGPVGAAAVATSSDEPVGAAAVATPAPSEGTSGQGGDPQSVGDPNNPTTQLVETHSVEGSVSNKALGIGLGVGIGCVAAIGLAGMLVHNRRKQQQNDSSPEDYPGGDDGGVNTRWRTQSFMGVVASVVAKLPRSASLRSSRSNETAGDVHAGMAVGTGHGAIENPAYALGRHPSNSSSYSGASQPPSLARVYEYPDQQHQQMQTIDLRY